VAEAEPGGDHETILGFKGSQICIKIFEVAHLHLVVLEGEHGADLVASVDHHDANRGDGQDGTRKRAILVFLVGQEQSEGLLIQVKPYYGFLAALKRSQFLG